MAAVTCQDLVTAAYRDAGIKMDDEQPEAEEASRGMSLLQRIYKSFDTAGLFGPDLPRLLTGDYTGEEGAAVTVESGTPVVTYPTAIASATDPLPYGQESVNTFPAGVDYSNRAPRDLSVIRKNGTTPSLKVYDAPTGSWVEILGLTLTDAAPFASRWEDELTALLTERLARSPVSNEIKTASAKAWMRLAYRPTTPHTPTQAEYF